MTGGADAVPLVDLNAVHEPMLDDLRTAFDRVVSSGLFSSGGEVEQFEERLAELAGVDHAVGVGSGTAALQLMLMAAGIGRGDEVILPPNTFVATAEAVIHAGAVPVFVDVDLGTALVDAEAVAAEITPRTAAIIGVHLYGQPVPADALRALARRHGLLFFEDAAQAIGAAWHGDPVGGLGAGAAFSFYPGKNIGALGEGGAVTTDDGEIARQVRMLRSHGESAKHVHDAVGFNERMDELQAALLSVKLSRNAETQQARDEAVGWYAAGLSEVPGIRQFSCPSGARHVHHLMVVEILEADRDRVLDGLHTRGIGAAVHYPVPIHRQPAYRQFNASCPNAERLAGSIVSLPLYPGMTRTQVDRCLESLDEVLG
jgi:dTDP-4-amino-4,6-dideoxygalactose transaminase